jgi:archaemetzincin
VRKAVLLLVLAATSTVAVVLWARRAGPPARPCADCASLPRPPLPPEEPEAGHERLGAPQPGEWRHAYREPRQTVERYVATAANRRCAHRTTIYLQPLDSRAGRLGFSPAGEAAYPKLVERMREYLEAFFGVKTAILPAIPIFEDAYVAERDQYDADRLTDRLAARVPADAIAYVGLTKEDLYSPGLNFVFGVGSLSARAGAYSLRRLQSPDPVKFLERGLKLVVHETGHIFSVHHCTEWRCVMQGANSVVEQDGHPLRLCPDDLRKLEWNAGFQRRPRFERLLELHRAYGFKAEAGWLEKRLR